MKDKKNKYPLSVNFKTLQQYDLKKTGIDEILFFEWLIVKKLSFGSDEFFYQNNRIFNEIPIKRHRLDKVKVKFICYGMEKETKGFSNTTNYLITDEFIENFVKIHLLPEFRKNTLKELLSLDFKYEIKVSKAEIKRIIEIIDHLEMIYNDRRERYIDKNTARTLSKTGLSHNNKTYQQFKLLTNRYELKTIENSFVCFVDDLINRHDYTSHVLNNFSSYNRAYDSFPVFEARLNKFNLNYSIPS